MEEQSLLGRPGKAKEIACGAEAVIWRKGPKVVKERVSKGYRLKQLDDRIRNSRTKSEMRILERASLAGVNVPRLKGRSGTSFGMEYIDGLRLKDHLNEMKGKALVCKEIGKAIATLHASDLVHGDLTTSNMIWKEHRLPKNSQQAAKEKGSLYLIDFGLSKHSKRLEDKAQDLFLLYEALKAAHFSFLSKAWGWILHAYKWEQSKLVLAQLEKIKKRRRYK